MVYCIFAGRRCVTFVDSTHTLSYTHIVVHILLRAFHRASLRVYRVCVCVWLALIRIRSLVLQATSSRVQNLFQRQAIGVACEIPWRFRQRLELIVETTQIPDNQRPTAFCTCHCLTDNRCFARALWFVCCTCIQPHHSYCACSLHVTTHMF